MTTAPSLTLEKQGLDPASTRRQMLFGTVLIFVVCLVEYWSGLFNTGTARLGTVSVLFASSVVVSLITLELTGQTGNRLRAVPAIWAGLLFAAYPVHPEVLLWPSLDLFGTFFYLAALHSFLRYQLLWEKRYLTSAIVSAAAAGLTSDLALTLPLVMMLATLLLPVFSKDGFKSIQDHKKTSLSRYQNAFKATWQFWAAIGATIGLHWVAPQLTTSEPVPRGTLNNPTVLSVLPLISADHPWMLTWLAGLTVLIGCVAIIRVRMGRTDWNSFLFLGSFFALALLPALYSWHKLFLNDHHHQLMLASAPLCIFFSMAAQPGIDAMKRKRAIPIVLIGALLMSALFLTLSYCLQLNLENFQWQQSSATIK